MVEIGYFDFFALKKCRSSKFPLHQPRTDTAPVAVHAPEYDGTPESRKKLKWHFLKRLGLNLNVWYVMNIFLIYNPFLG